MGNELIRIFKFLGRSLSDDGKSEAEMQYSLPMCLAKPHFLSGPFYNL